MALPTIKIACSNGHFQESLQNHGDTGTWTSNDGTSPTKLIDSGADWVVDEWIGYYVVFDTGGTPTPIIITDNDQTSITVAGDYSAQVGKNYRIAGGITGTVTANASASDEIALTAVKDKYGAALPGGSRRLLSERKMEEDTTGCARKVRAIDWVEMRLFLKRNGPPPPCWGV